MSAYQHAIHQTSKVIERRMRQYRRQVMAIGIVILVSIVGVLILASFAPLLALLLLVPLCGLFLLTDAMTLDAWRSDLLRAWAGGKLDIAAFSSAIRANPILPRAATEGMLATLPWAGDLVDEQRLSSATRQAVAAMTVAAHRAASEVLVLKTAASVFVGCVLITAVVLHRWEPLLVLLGLVSGPAVAAWLRRRHLARARSEVAACRSSPDFSDADYARLVTSLE
jgi:hypothetical protein